MEPPSGAHARQDPREGVHVPIRAALQHHDVAVDASASLPVRSCNPNLRAGAMVSDLEIARQS